METKEISGEVQNIRKDRKAIQIENVWYSSNFKAIPETINKGDNVLIKYTEKGQFKNVKSIEKLDIEESEKAPEKRIKDSTAVNNLVMCSKDIFINLGKDSKKTLLEVTKDVIESYKEIRDNISK